MLIKYKTDQIENHRLGMFNLSKKCIVLNNKNTDYKRMVALIAKNDISRLDVLFTNCIKRGKSTRAICETLSRAIDGSYHHKGFSEKSKDIGVLVLKQWRSYSSAKAFFDALDKFMMCDDGLEFLKLFAHFWICAQIYSIDPF